VAPPEARSQVELLHQISNIVSSNVSLERMLQELIGMAVDVTGCDACLVYLVDHASHEIVLRASQLPHAPEIGNIRMKMGEGITGWVAQHKAVVALPANAAADARFKSFQALPEDTYEAFLSVPLISNGELIGVINVHHKAQHAHTPKRPLSSASSASNWAAPSPSPSWRSEPRARPAAWRPWPDWRAPFRKRII